MENKIKILLYSLITVLIFSLFTVDKLYAQKETWNWFFGDSAGVTFMPEGENAQFLPNGKTKMTGGVQEGTSTISDRNGNLLLYSDGVSVWNKNHDYLLHGGGLRGNISSARNSIIIPRPGSNRFYYIFTIDDRERNRYGLRYSVIDILAHNQRGEIVPTEKNILLLPNVYEKMITVNHSNENDIWLITYNWINNEFYVYLITKDGIQPPKRFSNPYPAATIEAANLDYDIENKKLINCDWGNNSFVIFDFNPANGNINTNNFITIPAYPEEAETQTEQDWFRPYSGVFSADGKFFYGSCWQNSIVQWDFSNGDIDEIIASRTVIADSNTVGIENRNFGAIRRGPDNRIYIARARYGYLGVINNPELKGADCDFQNKGIYLEGGRSWYGLPIMMNYSHPVFYTVDLNSEPQFAGTLTGDGSYNLDDKVTISAVANPGFEFKHWQDLAENIISEEAEFELTVKSDTVLTAVFRQIAQGFLVVIAVSPSYMGTTNVSTGLYPLNHTGTVIASPRSDAYKFVYWSNSYGDTLSKNASFDFVIKSDTTFVAHFELDVSIFSEIIKTEKVIAYPNPTKDDFKILFEVIKSGNIAISLLDLSGREVLEIFNDFIFEGVFSQTVKTNNLARGVYFLKIQIDDSHFIIERIIFE